MLIGKDRVVVNEMLVGFLVCDKGLGVWVLCEVITRLAVVGCLDLVLLSYVGRVRLPAVAGEGVVGLVVCVVGIVLFTVSSIWFALVAGWVRSVFSAECRVVVTGWVCRVACQVVDGGRVTLVRCVAC